MTWPLRSACTVAVMDNGLTVGDVTARTGVSRKALRVYEAKGLVEPLGRTRAGYRLYDEEALRRLELVQRAKHLGLSLAEVKEFLYVADGCCGTTTRGSRPWWSASSTRPRAASRRWRACATPSAAYWTAWRPRPAAIVARRPSARAVGRSR